PTIDSGEEIKLALKSWLRNDPFEVIFITIDKARPGLEELARSVDPDGKKVRVITIKKPNKRNQMVAGVNHVKTEITVFCDDDVLWPDTMLKWMLAPFEDKQMGGVGTSQTVLPVGKRMTIWEILAAYRISMRNIEIVSTTYIDGGVCCLSGRTATYRTCILRDPDFQWSFTHEFWRGKYHQHSGDDKFLTRWLHSHSWKTYIQACPEAELSSTFKNNWRFLKQLLRWTRNTWRSDIRSLIFERHIWFRHPFVAFTMLDKFFNPITLLAGPVTVAYLATRKDERLPVWVIIVSYIAWLIITRLIKYMPHFVKRPQDVLAIPVWLVFNIYFAMMKVYCLFTLHVTDWGTRTGADHKTDKTVDEEIYVPHWMADKNGMGGGDDKHSLSHVEISMSGDGTHLNLPSMVQVPPAAEMGLGHGIPRGVVGGAEDLTASTITGDTTVVNLGGYVAAKPKSTVRNGIHLSDPPMVHYASNSSSTWGEEAILDSYAAASSSGNDGFKIAHGAGGSGNAATQGGTKGWWNSLERQIGDEGDTTVSRNPWEHERRIEPQES
ncbi:hypothetical protein HDU76_009802, partial [Blyttiomyces sp. JEL0837]